MDDNTTYYKDPPKRIYELMQDTLGDNYQYFLGSPISLAQSAYPCVVVLTSEANNTIQNAPTSFDNVSEKINIHILMLEQSNAASTGTTDTVMRNLYNIVQGRDPATGFYMSDTVMYALRTNIDLSGTLIDHDIDINYDVSQTDERNVIEAIVTIVTRERVQVPNRIDG